MSTSRCGEICITPPKYIYAMKEGGAILAVELLPPCPEMLCFVVKEKHFVWLPKEHTTGNQWISCIYNTVPEQFNPNIGECAAQFTDDCVLNQGKSSLQCEHWMAVDTIKWGNSNITRTVCKYVSIFKELANVYSNASFEHCRVTFVVCRFSDHKCRHSNVSTARYNAQYKSL